MTQSLNDMKRYSELFFEDEFFITQEMLNNAKETSTIYKYNADLKKTAFLNWRFHSQGKSNMDVLAEPFMDVAGYILEGLLEDNHDKKADSLIFPILFNMSHGIELYLKAIREEIDILILYKKDDYNCTEISTNGHNIKNIIKSINDKIIEMGKNKVVFPREIDELKDLMSVVEHIVNNFIKEGEEGEIYFFSRYPISHKTKKGYFYNQSYSGLIEKSNFNYTVDLEDLYNQYLILYRCLDHIYFMLSVYIDGYETDRKSKLL